MRNRLLLAGLGWLALPGGLPAQDPPPADPGAVAPRAPADLFREAQALIRDGRFDVAAERLKQFLAANPTDADFLVLARTDPATFQKLRNVAVWSDDPGANAEAVKTREEVILRSDKAFRAAGQDDKRIRQLVRNLAGIREERLFAVQELGKLGTAFVPALADELRNTQDADLRVGIFEAARTLPADAVPGLLAATDGLPGEAKLGILRAVVGRADVLSLATTPETDFTPYLWHLAGDGTAESGPLRAFAVTQLDRLSGGRSARLRAEDELTRLAEPFVAHTARYRGGDRPTIWSWDAAANRLTSVTTDKPAADEYYGVRTLRWALERNPNHQPAQDQFLTLTTERAVDRAGTADLSAADPVLYRILAAAPATTLVNLLDRALTGNRTSLAVGLTQVLAARGDRLAADTGVPNRPGVLVRALDYPDFRVQFAAAQGLLRAPNSASSGKQGRIVEILKRAAAAETEAPGAKTVGRALVADPVDVRGEKTARYLRGMGYTVERLPTGRALLRRAGQAADYDLIVIDRHVAAPTVEDTLAQLRGDAVAGRRPVLLVASSDLPPPVGVEPLLARLATLALLLPDDLDRQQPIPAVEPAFFFDPRKPVTDEAQERAAVRARRDVQLRTLFDRRLLRLRQFVAAAELPQSRLLAERLDDRLPQLVLSGLQARHGITPASAPRTFERLQYHTDRLARQPAAAFAALPTGGLPRLVESLENQLVDKREFDAVLARLYPTVGGADAAEADPKVLAGLTRLAKLYPAVTVIPEPFSPGEVKPDGVGYGLQQEVAQATADPASRPVPPAVKKQQARQAVRWLRALAVGENPGYDIRPAEPALRQALRDDELADDAIDAVGTIPTAEAQQDLLGLALSAGRPLPLRVRAARATVRHLQTFGRFVPAGQAADVAKQAGSESDPQLRANLLVVEQLAAGKPADLGRLMTAFPTPLPKPPAPPAADDPAKKPEEKKPAEEKKE